MQCNIDERGARLRRVWGIVGLLAAAGGAGAAWWLADGWLWLAAGVCAGMGGFALFEARKKWCAIRAMGMKTPV